MGNRLLMGKAMRMPFLSVYPKHVSELETMAEQLPSVLRQLAAALRAEGLEDMRSEFDKRREQWDAERLKMLESLRAADAVDPHVTQ